MIITRRIRHAFPMPLDLQPFRGMDGVVTSCGVGAVRPVCRADSVRSLESPGPPHAGRRIRAFDVMSYACGVL